MPARTQWAIWLLRLNHFCSTPVSCSEQRRFPHLLYFWRHFVIVTFRSVDATIEAIVNDRLISFIQLLQNMQASHEVTSPICLCSWLSVMAVALMAPALSRTSTFFATVEVRIPRGHTGTLRLQIQIFVVRYVQHWPWEAYQSPLGWCAYVFHFVLMVDDSLTRAVVVLSCFSFFEEAFIDLFFHKFVYWNRNDRSLDLHDATLLTKYGSSKHLANVFFKEDRSAQLGSSWVTGWLTTNWITDNNFESGLDSIVRPKLPKRCTTPCPSNAGILAIYFFTVSSSLAHEHTEWAGFSTRGVLPTRGCLRGRQIGLCSPLSGSVP